MFAVGQNDSNLVVYLTIKLVLENFGWGVIARWRPLVAGLLGNMLSGQVT